SKVIDFYMYGVSPKLVRMSIISAEPDLIMQYVMNEIGRGVTIEKITGAYTNVERRKLAVLCSPRESVLIRNFIAEHDGKAMITLTAVDSVWGDGSGFKSLEG
ncbi:MAG: YitT family protein, partial [Firmicutes bacterium]|nr:YitT family protein [Bacillota bacterium]